MGSSPTQLDPVSFYGLSLGRMGIPTSFTLRLDRSRSELFSRGDWIQSCFWIDALLYSAVEVAMVFVRVSGRRWVVQTVP